MSDFETLVKDAEAKAMTKVGGEITATPAGGDAITISSAIVGPADKVRSYDQQGNQTVERRSVTILRSEWNSPAIDDTLTIEGASWRIDDIDEQDFSITTVTAVKTTDNARHSDGHFVRAET
ncbi:hypothetical protein STSP2_03159 [Anaerohalosphaera lusitana]|uniref:Uncharacterized protein n=1 Tax=Anaerohalosphaera lusitana TaxID=1936003 RepID=A0A1U9NPX6_9BACT|nr:hypothetical protein [Anaerohalosphaera lusitana]AQT69959.1 hypothetical protein STSP2_03159 [Anaerohalosphaera lusitana]